MATHDVPGANPLNNDELKMGCWAEHEDGSLIFVESTEGNRVVFSMFDISKEPPVEYRDAMPIESFKKTFSWDSKNKRKSNEKWLWHDKTPFDWNKVIKKGFGDGQRFASADGLHTAAERVAESLRIQGITVDRERSQHRTEQTHQESDVFSIIADKIRRAIGELVK